ncbi:hypothetical protein ACQ4PT_014471 [Festuca glaucescens]
MVARLTPDQKVACSIHVGFKSPNYIRPIIFYFCFSIPSPGDRFAVRQFRHSPPGLSQITKARSGNQTRAKPYRGSHGSDQRRGSPELRGRGGGLLPRRAAPPRTRRRCHQPRRLRRPPHPLRRDRRRARGGGLRHLRRHHGAPGAAVRALHRQFQLRPARGRVHRIFSQGWLRRHLHPSPWEQAALL